MKKTIKLKNCRKRIPNKPMTNLGAERRAVQNPLIQYATQIGWEYIPRDEAEKQFPAEVFTIYWILKKENVEYAEEKAARMTNVLERFPYWKTSDQHKREVQRELYEVLVPGEERKRRVGDWLETEQSIEDHEPFKLNLPFLTVIVSKIMTALKG